MKRIVALLCVLLILSACTQSAAPTPPGETTASPTEAVAFAELTLDEAEYRTILNQRPDILSEVWKSFDEDENNLRLSKTTRLVVRVMEEYQNAAREGTHGFREIVYLEESTGKETVLMRGNGEANESASQPCVAAIINERYFVYVVGGWDGYFDQGIYDLNEMKAYPADLDAIQAMKLYPFFRGTTNGSLYFAALDGDDITNWRYLWKTDISMLDINGKLQLENLLEGTAIELDRVYMSAVSPDGRHYAMGGERGCVLINLESGKEIYRMGEEYAQHMNYLWFDSADTIYIETDRRNTLYELNIK